PSQCRVFLCEVRLAPDLRLCTLSVSACRGKSPKPSSQINGLLVECPSAVCMRRCAVFLASVQGSDWQAGYRARLVELLYPLFLAARTKPIHRPSSRSQEPRSCAFRRARVGGLLAKR